jgi:hypothetical protein
VLDGQGAFGPAQENDTTVSGADWFGVHAASNAPIELPAYCDLILTGLGYVDTVRIPVLVGDSMNLPGGPDAYGYRIYDYTDSCYARMPGYDWFELRGVGTRLVIGGDETQQFSLPPEFGVWRYYGTDYDSISICSNGWVAPGWSDRCDFVNVMLPYSGSPPNIVAVQWDDLDPTLYGSIWYYDDSANHRFIVEYDSVPYFGHTQDWEKVQVQVYDRTITTPTGDNTIVVQFRNANDYKLATVGLQNRDGSAGLTHTWNGWYPRVAAPLKSGTALRFEAVELTGMAEESRQQTAHGLQLAARPNPFRTRTAISLQLAADSPAGFAIFDASGRLVRVLSGPALLTADALALTWDGCDGSGRPVPPGLYFVRAAGQSLKLVRLP